MARPITTHVRTWGAAYLLATIGVAATLVAVHRHLDAARFQEHAYFVQRARDLQNALQERINLNIHALIGIRALFDSSEQVHDDEFQSYLLSTGILEHNRELHRVGFAQRQNDHVHNAGQVLVKYLAPSVAPLGFPGERLCAEQIARPFCALSRDSGVPIGTRWITAGSDAHTRRFSLLLVPIYRHPQQVSSVRERRAALNGFVFAEFSLPELLADLQDTELYQTLHTEIFDQPQEAADRTPPRRVNRPAFQFGRDAALAYIAPLSLGGTRWYLQIAPGDGFTFPPIRDRLPWILIAGALVTSLLTCLAAVQARTIGERRRQTEALEHQVVHDSLTGLPNRYFLHRELGRVQSPGAARPACFTLGLIDLDGFKEINDTLGHQAGDRVLRELGPRLRAHLGHGEIIARLGGDEFAVVDYAAGDVRGAQACAQRILNALHEPFEVSGIKVRVGASIGLALYPEHGTDAGALLRCADVAMYSAKNRGSGFSLYAAENDPHTPRRLALMTELQDAIRSDQLVLHYQPIVDIASGTIVCAEALLRWRHPEHGLVPPEEFIPQVENHELIRPLSLWVLNQALAQNRRWQDRGMGVKIAVNMSARNIQDIGLPEQIRRALHRHGVAARMLELELTETAVMQDRERSFEVLSKISALGVSIVIDDFGTGYSSLAYLRTLPVRAFKIDRSFVVDITHNDNSAVIVRALIDLAHNIGLTVVAEGIETQDNWDILEILRCDHGQGYFIARPLTETDFTAWMSGRIEQRTSPALT